MIMKKILFSFLCINLLAASVSAQTVKVYAYSQPGLKGVNQKDIVAENGQEIKVDPSSSNNYLLYFTYSGTAPIKISGVWLNGKAYNVKTEPIKKTPVELKDDNATEDSKTITLVPKTKNKVIQLTLSSKIDNPAKLSGAKKKDVESSELVVSYSVNGKKLYKTVKKITVLKASVSS